MIELKNVTVNYNSDQSALHNISLTIDKGEFVFIVGKSGAGKSTLIKLLLREIVPTSGNVVVDGVDTKKIRRKEISSLRRKIGVVFQDFRLLKDRNIYHNVAFAQEAIEVKNNRIVKNVNEILATVGLEDKLKSMPNELSGGEQQRAAVARALVNVPPILLADEPTGNLDPRNSLEIMKLLENINKKGTTVIVVTHNHNIVRRFNKRVIELRDGNIALDTTDYYINKGIKRANK